MAKHAVRRHKIAVRHPGAANSRRNRKMGQARKPAPAAKQTPDLTKMAAPSPRIVQLIDLEFPDPDEVPYEEAAVTSFDDEDF